MIARLASRITVSFAALGLLALAACSAETSSADDGVADSESAATSCGARYNESVIAYQNAVRWSKARIAEGECVADHGLQWEIADEASKAVMGCGRFRDDIRTSRWAEPLREALGQSLTLRSLTGELLVIKDSEWQNWTGTERFFEEGLTFWARAEGALGPAVRVEFHAGGKAMWGQHHFDEDFNSTWREDPATYTITKTDERGKRTITVEHAGVTSTFVLGVESGATYDAAPIFVLEPTGEDIKLYSLVSECDA